MGAEHGMERVNLLVREMELAMDGSRPFEDKVFKLPYKVGVDLGTSNVVITVLDQEDRPVGGALEKAHVVRDGIVVEYVRAVTLLQEMKKRLERRLGTVLHEAATAIPPGISPGNVKVITNVVEAAGFRLIQVIDEPEAAAKVLRVRSGAVVDIGGGTTGISIIRNCEVAASADEPTGGVHMTLVISGNLNVDFATAEQLKHDPEQHRMLSPIVQPVIEKMANIAMSYIPQDIETVYLAGGSCCLQGIEKVFAKYTSLSVRKPDNPLLVTPIGIAMSAKGDGLCCPPKP